MALTQRPQAAPASAGPPSTTAPLPPPQPERRDGSPTTTPAARPEGGQLLLRDLRVAYLLANDVRYRAFERFLGIPREQANLFTALALLLAADRAHDAFKRAMVGPTRPSATGMVLGGATVRGGLAVLSGPSAADTPLFGSLLALAAVAGPARRATAASATRIRASGRRMDAAFHRRYGYLIDPGHRRLRHAQRRARAFAERVVATEPVATEPVSPEPVSPEPVGSEPAAREPAVTAPAAHTPLTPEDRRTDPDGQPERSRDREASATPG